MSKSKTPKLFRKQLKTRKWKKKILKNIHIPADRKFIEDLFEQKEDRMVLREEPTKDQLKKLKSLSKSIKKNKGMVTKWKAAILLVLAGLVLAFNFFFKNMVVERALEKSMEELFQSSADVIDPDISLSGGTFTLKGLMVQDKSNPGRNLFETGNTELAVSIPELTRNRLRIESIVLQGIQFNSSRDNALLPEGSKEEGDSQPLLSLSDLSEDPEAEIRALIEEQKDNLQTLKYLKNADEQVEEFTERWEQKFETSRREVQEFTGRFTSLIGEGAPTLSSIEDGQAILNEYEGYYKEIDSKKSELISMQKQFLEEKNSLMDIRAEVEDLIQADLSYLKGLMTLPDRGDVQNFVSDKIEEILKKRFQDYYEKIQLVMPYYEKWKAKQEKDDGGRKENRRLAGRNILYPSPDSPKFLIETINLDGGDNYSGRFNIDLTGISSEPEKWAEPVKLSSAWSRDEAELNLHGFLNLKEDAEQLYQVDFSSPANPAPLGEGIPALGIDTAEAMLSYSGSSRPHPVDEGMLVSLDMNFSSLAIKTENANEILGNIMEETLQEISEFLVSAEIHISAEGIQSIKTDSDIDEILKEKLADVFKDLPQQGLTELESYLREMISDELLDSEELNAVLETLNLQSRDQINSLDDLDNQLKGYEDQVKNQGDALLKDLEDQARAEAERIQAEAEQKKKEAEAQARAEAEKRQQEAEEKARLEAEKLKEDVGDIKLPGF